MPPTPASRQICYGLKRATPELVWILTAIMAGITLATLDPTTLDDGAVDDSAVDALNSTTAAFLADLASGPAESIVHRALAPRFSNGVPLAPRRLTAALAAAIAASGDGCSIVRLLRGSLARSLSGDVVSSDSSVGSSARSEPAAVADDGLTVMEYNRPLIEDLPVADLPLRGLPGSNSVPLIAAAVESTSDGSVDGEAERDDHSSGTDEVLSDAITGLLLVLAASICAGFRWACSELLVAPTHVQPSRRAVVVGVDGHMEGDVDGDDVEGAVDSSIGLDGEPLETIAQSARSLPPAMDGEEGGEEQDDGKAAALHPFALVYGTAPFGLLLLLPVGRAISTWEHA